ncbi:hypothetical protein [Flavisolibacter tropicus]|uniref:Uncharacterized protein n=1 Tax=Flavisolibacter tropicus TaxID=1492898 RepID=A0A172TV16_9BACT|nr:hypothetical protein [Flavisolibacter tropicus]ANE50925.1 hypothetical protein SY85_10835 [Flavisolibacter tropicus]
MNRTILLFCLLLTISIAYGQAQKGSVSYQKRQQTAAVIELPYTPNIVMAALNDYLSKKGRSKSTDLKGFTTYRNTTPVANDSTNADLYFKVERKSRQDKETTIVSLLLTMPSDETTNPTNQHYLNMDEAKVYLNELTPAIEAYNLELQIKDQNGAVTAAEDRYKNLTNEGSNLEKRKEELDKKIHNNKMEQQAQLNEIELQKQKLATKVSERKA